LVVSTKGILLLCSTK